MGAAATEIRRAQLSDAPEMTRLAALAGLLADERHFKGGPSGRAS